MGTTGSCQNGVCATVTRGHRRRFNHQIDTISRVFHTVFSYIRDRQILPHFWCHLMCRLCPARGFLVPKVFSRHSRASLTFRDNVRTAVHDADVTARALVCDVITRGLHSSVYCWGTQSRPAPHSSPSYLLGGGLALSSYFSFNGSLNYWPSNK